jgi:hypothetical protein
MSLTRRGAVGWIKISNGQLQTDRFGLSQATARWARMDVGDANPGAPTAVGLAHPLWPYLDCDKVTVTQNEAGWDCEAQFFGVAGSPEPVYELDFSTSEEPIETHREFRRRIGGTPADPLNGATFDPDGAFIGFAGPFSSEADADTWRGITSYLNPGAVWRKNYVTKVRPTDLGDLGHIDVPEGNPPLIRPAGIGYI